MAVFKNAVSRLWLVIVVLITLPVIALTVLTPMSVAHQGLFGLITVAAMLILLRLRAKSKPIAVFLILLSAVISTRYLYWRATETLVFQSTLEAILGYGLFAAETYAWLILIMGYLQNLWPLERKVEPLPDDMERWPSVDVYIPSYNESLQIVQDTVLAAQNIDYPRDKLSIYLLDDGRRPDFAAFAASAGVGYITRDDNQHAKAGNLNHALSKTGGELICIFDCDHVATRGFLQMTTGSFLVDDKLALIQTPHHFYSPDPFERNLSVGHQMPSEDELFYGLIQKGNDYWNATFFCGSCAVIRRSALEEIDGFAVETVTEDAHTALKLQRRGWKTAYLGIPLAAGLATERLSLHVGQRMRWARGMTQILRRDNPMLGRGLSFMQRLCYLNAILHFQFGLPRIVFLTAPLAYLLIGQNIIAASASMIFVYALPHLAHTLALNSLLQGRYRFSFWAEIYETVLSFHLVKVTLSTLINPRRGKFNVTDKGGLLPEGFFDFRIVRPHLIVAVLLFVAIVWGVVRLIWDTHFGIERGVMFLNLFWASFSLLMLMAAIAVARETRQVRHDVRVDVSLPATVYMASGHAISGLVNNLSMGGARIEVPSTAGSFVGEIEWIELHQDQRYIAFPVSEIRREALEERPDTSEVRLRFGRLDIGQRRMLVRAVMGRADAWLPTGEQVDHPLRSLWWVVKAVFGLFFTSWQRRHDGSRKTIVQSAWPAGRLLLLTFLAALLLITARSALSQESVSSDVTLTAGPRPSAVTGLPAPQRQADGGLSFLAGGSGNASSEASGPVWESVTLGELNGERDMVLGGSQTHSGVAFSLRPDDIATQASLVLDIRMPETEMASRAFLNVSLNGQLLRSVVLDKEAGERFSLTLPVAPALLVTHNQLDFAITRQQSEECLFEEGLSGGLVIAAESLIQLSRQRFALGHDLANYPLPFFDDVAISPPHVSIVVPEHPSETTLQAAALMASYIGTRVGSRGIDFDTHLGELPAEDAIVFTNRDEPIPGITAAQSAGDGVRLIDNPRDPTRTLMLIHGDDAAGVLSAARYFVANQPTLSGAEVAAKPVTRSSPEAYQVPNWISTQAPVRLDALVTPDTLVSPDIAHSAIDINFRASPDLFLWPGDTIPLRLRYTFPGSDWLDETRSRLDVNLNGTYLGSLGVNHTGFLERAWGWLGGDTRRDSGVIDIPPYLIYGENTLSLYFNIQTQDSAGCAPVGGNVQSEVDGTSTLDLSRTRHFDSLPNLSYFVGAGFPFTRYADLSTTAFILSAQPDANELTAMMGAAARLGESSGVAAYGARVGLGVTGLQQYSDRDLLVIATTDSPVSAALLAEGSVRIIDNKLVAEDLPWSQRMMRWAQGDWRNDGDALQRALISRRSVNALIGVEAPSGGGRSAILLTAADSGAMPKMMSAFSDLAVSAAIRGDVVLIDSDRTVSSFSLSPKYQVGSMPLPLYWVWLFSQRPWWLMWLLIGCLLMCTMLLYPALKQRAANRQPSKEDRHEA